MALAQDLAGLRGRADGEERGAARAPGARMPESLCAGWRVDWSRLLQRSSRLPPQLEAGKPHHPSFSSQPSSSLLPPGPSSPAVPGRTQLHPPPEPAGQCGGGQHPPSQTLGPGPLGERAGLPWIFTLPPEFQVTRASLVLLSAEARTSLCSHVPLTTLLSTTSSHPALPLASGLQPLLLLGFPTRRCQALPLSWYSVRFPPPQPLSSPLSTLSSPAAPSEAQVQGNRCFLPARPSLRGWQVRAWRPPYSCPRLPGGHWEIKKRAVCVKDCRITAEKVLTWGQPQAKPFYNQSGNQAGPRRVRNKWAQRGGGEAGSPGK